MRGGPRSFIRSSTSSVLLWYASRRLFVPPTTGLSPSLAGLSRPFVWDYSARGARNPGTNPGLGSSDFARRYSRNRCLFLFLQVLRCFSSLRSPLVTIHSSRGHPKVGFPHSEISGSIAYLPANPSVSSAITSFVASRCQGIHHIPLVT